MKAERTYTKEIDNANVKADNVNAKAEKLNDEFSEIYENGMKEGMPEPMSTGGIDEEKIDSGDKEQGAMTENFKENQCEPKETEKEECNKCYNEDSPETQKKKREAIEKFYKDGNKLKQVESILGVVFKEIFTGIEIDETAEDEIQNIAESFLTKRKWNVDKKPDYGQQLMYVIRYNLIPNMLTKYYGRKIKNMSDDERQIRNYYGTGHREKPFVKYTFTREMLPEFEINESEGLIVFGKEDAEGIHRIERASYESVKESKQKLAMMEEVQKKIEQMDKIVKKRGDNEVKMLWEIIKKSDDQVKGNIKAGKIMNKTPEEIKVIKRRLLRAVLRAVRSEEVRSEEVRSE